MKKRFNFKATAVLSTAILGSALFLAGCYGETDEAKTVAAPAAEQNAMDVKQPMPAAEPKATLQPAPAPAPVAEMPAAVEEKVMEVKEAEVKEAEVKEVVAAVSGEKAYATCVGCHGAKGEGGVGPRLNNQTVADIIAKLEKYKSGEQVGPMTGMMAPMAAGLSADDMKAIAEYVTTL